MRQNGTTRYRVGGVMCVYCVCAKDWCSCCCCVTAQDLWCGVPWLCRYFCLHWEVWRSSFTRAHRGLSPDGIYKWNGTNLHRSVTLFGYPNAQALKYFGYVIWGEASGFGFGYHLDASAGVGGAYTILILCLARRIALGVAIAKASP